ncbi:isoaspartyl peptidase/L-asparaginase family protein [Vulgatibacter incomptus]|uniref:Isoaspartyl peptidase n=1 Tax=Vulgatibacter incomptus TaxID=1391653 RepID=A0A0K1PEX7_9BACT|nr:isoaspartyl peptidase/L-asparaginase [Vulgatibacter incomptus]AKU92083.1 Isoaspartyl aminopeptidase [Vulgatibacter incomptus]
MAHSILVHGGAGPIASDDRALACAEGCLAAARIGHAILTGGGSALDAVEAACAALEDDPLFNAGTGACLNADGDVELDAAIMEGTSLRAGAVAAVRTVRNPIRLARLVMDRSPHVLLAAHGAERFAREQGVAPHPPSLLVTQRALDRWRQERARLIAPKPGTVGAVAIDAAGRVAAATSTGGTSGKRAGRVGDSPLPGCGLYADDAAGAVSATGQGEAIIRVVLSKHVCDRIAAGEPADVAAANALRELRRVNGEGGIIAVDRHGRLGYATNAARMSRASIDVDGKESSAFEP